MKFPLDTPLTRQTAFLALAYRGARAARIREAFITNPSSYPDDLLWEFAS